MKYKYLVALLIVLNVSCEDIFQYSPNEVSPHERNINATNISKIHQDATAPFRFIVISDIHHAYDELKEFVSMANGLSDIRFVAVAGDLTNFGLQFEYEAVHRELDKLNYPYIAVIGNHDLLANGQKVYEEMYGKMDFSFEVDELKFVFLNTNSREFGFPGNVPDLNFLQRELSDTLSYEKAFVIAHVPASDSDFDPNLSEAFSNILGYGKVTACINGHKHEYDMSEPGELGFYQVVSDDLKDRSYVLITVTPGDLVIEKKQF